MKKILIPAAMAVMLVIGAFGVSGAFAQDPPANHTGQQAALLGKVASILGIDQQKVTDAFAQASKELQNEQIDKALAEGRITQQRADWMKARPDNGALGIPFKGGMHGGFGGRFGGRPPATAPTPAPVPEQ